MRTTIMTPSTSTMTRTITTRTICTSEHSSTPLVVFPVLMLSHDPLGSRPFKCLSLHPHVIHDVRFSLTSSSSLSTSTCPSPSSSTPLSWRTLTCIPTSTTWTPWKITCATPPRGALTPTTSPSPHSTTQVDLVNNRSWFFQLDIAHHLFPRFFSGLVARHSVSSTCCSLSHPSSVTTSTSFSFPLRTCWWDLRTSFSPMVPQGLVRYPVSLGFENVVGSS